MAALECNKIDELMMEYLYRELDADSTAQFRTHVDGCKRCSTELAGLERTRKAIRSLPETDPPPSVTALLLHEAAKRAPSKESGEAKQGFWAWLTGVFQPVAAHPALAAAFSLVLVAGVAGYLSMKGLVTDDSDATKTLEQAEIRDHARADKLEAQPGTALEFEARGGEQAGAAPTPPAEGFFENKPSDSLEDGEEDRRGRMANEETERNLAGSKRKQEAPAKDSYGLDSNRSYSRDEGASMNAISPDPSASQDERKSKGKSGGGGGGKFAQPPPKTPEPKAEPAPEPPPAPVSVTRGAADRGENLKLGNVGAPSGTASTSGPQAQPSAPAPTPARPPAAAKPMPPPSQAPASPAAGAEKADWDDEAPVAEAEKAPARTEDKKASKEAEALRKQEQAAKPSKKQTETAAQLYRRAQTEVRGKSGCTAAARTASEVYRNDPTYYKKNLPKDPLLEKCVNQQRSDKRRAAPKPAPYDQEMDSPSDSKSAPANAH